MARHLSLGGSTDSMPPPVADYLRDIEARIPRWPLARRSALEELADGLRDAVIHYRSRGLNPEAAAERAVRDCGPASTVAAEFVQVLATGQARRTALALLLSGPLIGFLWLATLVPGQPPGVLLLRIPVLGLLAVTAGVTCLLTLLATGPAIRWLPKACPGPRRAAATACAAASAADVVVLSTAIFLSYGQLSGTRWMPGLIALSASLLRLTLTQRVARRDLMSSPAPWSTP
ncbi:MAG: hypothetical protein M3Y71_16100 [Actinomycetota bacterium]|nr:hypothetical protein [Actinomycetota bacterium]